MNKGLPCVPFTLTRDFPASLSNPQVRALLVNATLAVLRNASRLECQRSHAHCPPAAEQAHAHAAAVPPRGHAADHDGIAVRTIMSVAQARPAATPCLSFFLSLALASPRSVPAFRS